MSSDLAAQKRRLRRLLSQRRHAVPADEAARAAEQIAVRLLAEAVVRRSRRIALYAALPDEVPSRPLFEAFATLQKTLLLPRVLREAELEFAVVTDWSALRPGRYGVLEPPAPAVTIEPEEGDLVLVPGVAFDRAGNRLGRGKGFYDRAFRPGAPRAPLLMGVAYELQLVAAVPHTDRDRPMDAVVTESALHWMGRSAA